MYIIKVYLHKCNANLSKTRWHFTDISCTTSHTCRNVFDRASAYHRFCIQRVTKTAPKLCQTSSNTPLAGIHMFHSLRCGLSCSGVGSNYILLSRYYSCCTDFAFLNRNCNEELKAGLKTWHCKNIVHHTISVGGCLNLAYSSPGVVSRSIYDNWRTGVHL